MENNDLNYLKEITELNGYHDPDMADEAIAFYECRYPWFRQLGEKGIRMRGDTMNSFSTTFGKCNRETDSELRVLEDGKPRKDGKPPWKRGYTKALFENAETKEQVLRFRRLYHCLANFCVLPAFLNCWRGGSSGNELPPMGDYMDIFLEAVRRYYNCPEENPAEVRATFERGGCLF